MTERIFQSHGIKRFVNYRQEAGGCAGVGTEVFVKEELGGLPGFLCNLSSVLTFYIKDKK